MSKATPRSAAHLHHAAVGAFDVDAGADDVRGSVPVVDADAEALKVVKQAGRPSAPVRCPCCGGAARGRVEGRGPGHDNCRGGRCWRRRLDDAHDELDVCIDAGGCKHISATRATPIALPGERGQDAIEKGCHSQDDTGPTRILTHCPTRCVQWGGGRTRRMTMRGL